jgi:hypothetical protein
MRTPSLNELKGMWRRSLIARPDGTRDTTTHVRWLQSERLFVDLRQPAAMSDCSHAGCLDDLSLADCAGLATQEGFAGHLSFDGRHFEWLRRIDYQPASGTADAGSLEWSDTVLIERGRDVAYLEHWQRDESSTVPCAAALLRDGGSGTVAVLLRVGRHFMFARERPTPLCAQGDLPACVAAAPTLAAARALVDCEICCGEAVRGFAIAASTLPYRRGARLNPQRRGNTITLSDRDSRGTAYARCWDIVECDGDWDEACAAPERHIAT